MVEPSALFLLMVRPGGTQAGIAPNVVSQQNKVRTESRESFNDTRHKGDMYTFQSAEQLDEKRRTGTKTCVHGDKDMHAYSSTRLAAPMRHVRTTIVFCVAALRVLGQDAMAMALGP